MLNNLFDKYKTYIYLVSIIGLIIILNTQYSIVEGINNRKQSHNTCNKDVCKKKCPKNDIECLQRYAECGNCKYSVSSLNDSKQTNILSMYKINNNVYEKHDGDDVDVGSNIPKLGIIPAKGAGVLDPTKDIMYNNDKLNRSYMFFPVRKSTTGLFQETGPRASNV